MTAMRGCPYCSGWKRWDQIACNECNGTNSRRSYKERAGSLVACLVAAAVEELRVRCAVARMDRESGGGES